MAIENNQDLEETQETKVIDFNTLEDLVVEEIEDPYTSGFRAKFGIDHITMAQVADIVMLTHCAIGYRLGKIDTTEYLSWYMKAEFSSERMINIQIVAEVMDLLSRIFYSEDKKLNSSEVSVAEEIMVQALIRSLAVCIEKKECNSFSKVKGIIREEIKKVNYLLKRTYVENLYDERLTFWFHELIDDASYYFKSRKR